jgi:A/G-specific adenine glycosylase
MELGALICTPTAPQCDRCPLARQCVARREGLQEVIPPRKKPPAPVLVNEVGVVIRDGKRILICQRPPDAERWQNMWEAPHAERSSKEELSAAAIRIARELTGLEIETGAEILTIRHGVTRFAITLACLEAEYRGGSFAPGFYTAAKWLLPRELTDYPLSSPQRRLMTELAGTTRQKRSF